ncbi:vomeronasal type-1 receptor 1-like [Petaurus breviceps papuanus]|uniref:vomeronasal type-1 receptor 1-like n=1 Tax=Petaurus breviceps papuanus TaxID=3040969 RepID=UPI0036D9AF48
MIWVSIRHRSMSSSPLIGGSRRENSSMSISKKTVFLHLVLGVVFFMQTGAGLLGNFILLCHCTSTFLTGSRLKPIDMIFFHLALASSIVLIAKGVPQTMTDLGLNIILDRAGCRLLLFLHRVARGLTVSITCLLSGFQTITISSFTCTLLSELRTCVSKNIFTLCLLCWFLHIPINIFMLVNMQNFMESSNNTRIWNLGFCSYFVPATFNVSLFVIVYFIHDFLCVGFMVMASGYLVLFLQRHHRQVQHVHTSSLLSRRSPEIRATYTILVLVSIYVSFYSINSFLSFYLFQFDKYYQWLMPTLTLLAACYPAISPFVLISSDSPILYFICSLGQKKRSQDSLFPECSTAQHSTFTITSRYI